MINHLNRIDKSFNINNLDNYHLSLQLHLKGFSFCLLDRVLNKFIAIANFEFDKINSYPILSQEVEQILNNNEIFQYQFHHVKLLFASPKYTFIPSEFFSKKTAKTFYHFNQQLKPTETLLDNYIYGNSSYVSYTIPNTLYNLFVERFPNIKIFHHSSPHIEEILLKNKLQKFEQSIHINFYNNFFDIAYLKQDKLQLYNSFVFKTATDFQYFILNVCDQLELSVNEVPVFISGSVNRNDVKIENLKKFIKNVSFAGRPSHFEYSYIYNDIPDHYLLNLLNVYQCG